MEPETESTFCGVLTVWWNLSWDAHLMLKRSRDNRGLIGKDECQWQEVRQADPSLMQQPLDVVGKSEVLGGPQEACAHYRVCLSRPGPDTPENASCF